jgi:radical SAM protein with 4Fe4S-binding SPASM domain
MSQIQNHNPLRIVFWETTVRCNLSCSHCRRLSIEPTNELSSDEGRSIIDQLSQISERQHSPAILIFSGGEPLLRQDLLDHAHYAHERNIPTALASNGTLIDQVIAHRIVDAGISRVAISLDGPDAGAHDRMRNQHGSFERSLDGIHFIQETGAAVQINTTVSRSNLGTLPKMLDLAKTLNVVAWHVFVFVPVGCGTQLPTEELLGPAEAEDLLHWLYEVSQQNDLQIKPTCVPQYYRLLAQKKAPPATPTSGPASLWHRYTRGCLAGTNVCFINATGKVFPCGYLPVEAGDLRKQSLMEAWDHSPIFAQLRDDQLLKGSCGQCGYKKLCGGCRARAFGVYGDMLASEPGCLFNSNG